MQKSAVIDSGPLIALFDRDDAFHKRALNFIKEHDGKLYSTIAVVTEVSHLLSFSVAVQVDFLKWIARGALKLVDISEEDIDSICSLTQKYENVPMDFADASLVLIADKLNIGHVVSIDSDFYIYRTLSNGYLINIFPFEEGSNK
jgi:uncharacterized protein